VLVRVELLAGGVDLGDLRLLERGRELLKRELGARAERLGCCVFRVKGGFECVLDLQQI
jgi:hypothetical protein